jgi:hypothetical protein
VRDSRSMIASIRREEVLSEPAAPPSMQMSASQSSASRLLSLAGHGPSFSGGLVAPILRRIPELVQSPEDRIGPKIGWVVIRRLTGYSSD